MIQIEPRAVAALAVAAFGTLCAVFVVLAWLYYRARSGDASAFDRALEKLPWFSLFAAVLSGGVGAATHWPRRIGAIGASACSVLCVVGAVAVYRDGLSFVLSVSLVGMGILIGVLAWGAEARRARAAWAFLYTLVWVLALFVFFGAPLIRTRAGIDLWPTMIIPAVFAITAVALHCRRREFA